jgi:NADH-quinone oxidoreductase subunit L
MFRLVFLAFHGERRHVDHHDQSHAPHLHDAPPAMALALIVLAIGSLGAGYVALGGWFERFLEPSFAGALVGAEEHASGLGEGALMILSSAVAIAGIGLAAYFFLTNRASADRMRERFGGLHRLLTRKYYVDEMYDAVVVQPVRVVSEEGLWRGADVRVIDGAVNGVGSLVSGSSQVLRRLQTGSVRAYAASLFLGVVVILGYYLWPR